MTTAVEVKLTDETALAALRDVVAKRPEFVYTAPLHMVDEQNTDRCFYVHTDEDGSLVSAGCAIGAVLHELGVPLEELTKHEDRPAYVMLADVAPQLSVSVRSKLNDMQTYQDAGSSWGVAYAKVTGETI
ncbi:hypothetical protein ACIRLA_28970 [Streptomyces sp. NPDC102364]|uniref:hypothetical protein n=1 Tax=Streptomyces sp. NPDC102364 TaxID=3366161 RepID=UPI00381A6F0B